MIGLLRFFANPVTLALLATMAGVFWSLWSVKSDLATEVAKNAKLSHRLEISENTARANHQSYEALMRDFNAMLKTSDNYRRKIAEHKVEFDAIIDQIEEMPKASCPAGPALSAIDLWMRERSNGVQARNPD